MIIIRVCFIACLIKLAQEEKSTSITLYDPFHNFAGHARQLTSQISARIEYLISTHIIAVLLRLIAMAGFIRLNMNRQALSLCHRTMFSGQEIRTSGT